MVLLKISDVKIRAYFFVLFYPFFPGPLLSYPPLKKKILLRTSLPQVGGEVTTVSETREIYCGSLGPRKKYLGQYFNIKYSLPISETLKQYTEKIDVFEECLQR